MASCFFSSIRRYAIVAGVLLLVPASGSVALEPTLDFDARYVEADTEPPFSFPGDYETPAADFAPFDGNANQGGSESCPQEPSNATANASQDSTVDPTYYAGTGSASYSARPGDCDPASAVARSVYDIDFTTLETQRFDLDAALDHANVLLENDAGTPFVSVTDFTGSLSELLQLPADSYRILVELNFEALSMITGPDVVGSGSYDFTLALLPEAEVVYDNTVTESVPAQYNPGAFEYGDEIILGGTQRIVTEFEFIYQLVTGGAGQTARVRFYANDGPGGEPGTVLYDSSDFPLPATGVSPAPYSISGLSVPVPDSFTWTLEWDGMGETMTNRLYNPPVVGASDDDFYWFRSSGGAWNETGFGTPDIANFYAHIQALPEPARPMLLLTGAVALVVLRRARRPLSS